MSILYKTLAEKERKEMKDPRIKDPSRRVVDSTRVFLLGTTMRQSRALSQLS